MASSVCYGVACCIINGSVKQLHWLLYIDFHPMCTNTDIDTVRIALTQLTCTPLLLGSPHIVCGSLTRTEALSTCCHAEHVQDRLNMADKISLDLELAQACTQ